MDPRHRADHGELQCSALSGGRFEHPVIAEGVRQDVGRDQTIHSVERAPEHVWIRFIPVSVRHGDRSVIPHQPHQPELLSEVVTGEYWLGIARRFDPDDESVRAGNVAISPRG